MRFCFEKEYEYHFTLSVRDQIVLSSSLVKLETAKQ